MNAEECKFIVTISPLSNNEPTTMRCATMDAALWYMHSSRRKMVEELQGMKIEDQDGHRTYYFNHKGEYLLTSETPTPQHLVVFVTGGVVDVVDALTGTTAMHTVTIIDFDNIEDGRQCPLCCKDLDANQVCANCGFDANDNARITEAIRERWNY